MTRSGRLRLKVGAVAVVAALAVTPLIRSITVAQPGEGGCHPSYVGACVPVGVTDVDCLGGRGDGPYYVGRVRVVGPDVYRLDADGDGIACETSPNP